MRMVWGAMSGRVWGELLVTAVSGSGRGCLMGFGMVGGDDLVPPRSALIVLDVVDVLLMELHYSSYPAIVIIFASCLFW